jgi:nucleoside-diphosphate-sugar epimerase
MNTTTVTVFGATGAVGKSLICQLQEMHPEWRIRAICRSGKPTSSAAGASNADSASKVTWKDGDIMDLSSVQECVQDSRLVFSCLGFVQYERKYWASHWPRVVENLLQVCRQDRSLIFCDNIYAYGTDHDTIRRSSSLVPPSFTSKPGIRTHLHTMFSRHMKDYPGTVTVLGSADFFGPGVGEKSVLGDNFTGKIVQGQKPLAIGSVSHVHDFAYVPDLARAMIVASTNPKAYDQFWIVPHSIHGKTLQEIANDVAQMASSQTNTKPVKISVYGSWSCRLLSLVVPVLGEMVEMMPFWTKDYRVDDLDFIETFAMSATPYDEALKELIQSYTQEKVPSS